MSCFEQNMKIKIPLSKECVLGHWIHSELKQNVSPYSAINVVPYLNYDLNFGFETFLSHI